MDIKQAYARLDSIRARGMRLYDEHVKRGTAGFVADHFPTITGLDPVKDESLLSHAFGSAIIFADPTSVYRGLTASTNGFYLKPLSDVESQAEELVAALKKFFQMSADAGFQDLAEEAMRQAARQIDAAEPVENNQRQAHSEFQHGPDFRSIEWYGKKFSLTGAQAAVVEILWDAYLNKTPDVSFAFIVVKKDIASKRIQDVFKCVKDWQFLICAGQTKGTFRMNEPKK